MALYREQEYSTAVGVAMLAHEELGNHRILLDEWKKSVQTGKPPSVTQIRIACQGHIEKQKQGQLGGTLMTEGPSALDTALRTRVKDPGYQVAQKVLRTAIEAKVKRTPTERHEKRLESFFVD